MDNKTVFKYQVALDDEWHDLPIGPEEVVHVDVQGPGWVGAPVMVWAEVPSPASDDRPSIRVRVFGTGHLIPAHCEHVGSVVCADGALVWHLYRDPLFDYDPVLARVVAADGTDG